MAKTMRTTTHHGRGRGGRAYGTKHNDRNFDVTKADNIDLKLLAENQYWCLFEGETFEAAELRFYEENFGEQLKATNDKYVANRHPERCKTMEQWKGIKQNAPEESIFQIGRKSDDGVYADGATLMKCYQEFQDFQNQWNEEHGKPFTVLNTALHVDEPNSPPHIHTRKVWHYVDENGVFRIGQERALERAGIELPNPDKKESRYNNRKITYDRMMRDKWLDICQSHGLEVEREPVPGKKKSKELQEFVREDNERIAKAHEEAKQRLQVLETKAEVLEKRIEHSEGLLKSLWSRFKSLLRAVRDLVREADEIDVAVEFYRYKRDDYYGSEAQFYRSPEFDAFERELRRKEVSPFGAALNTVINEAEALASEIEAELERPVSERKKDDERVFDS